VLTISAELHARVLMPFTCYTGDLDEGMRVVQPIKNQRPAADLIGPMPYLAQQTLLDPAFPKGLRYYAKSDFLEGLTDEVIDAVVRYGTTMTSPLTSVTLQHYGGEVGHLPNDATAFSQRDRTMNLFTVTAWTDPEEDERHIAWTREFFEAIRPYSRGAYLNFLGADEDQRLRSACRPEAYERLVALKNKYDPTNLFRHNTNISPAP
jgi:FAD/FMN-containing dehydrogenase